MLRGKQRKKRNKEQIHNIKQRQIKEDLYTLNINYKGERTVGKGNKGTNVEK